jgi:hypothetical protein
MPEAAIDSLRRHDACNVFNGCLVGLPVGAGGVGAVAGRKVGVGQPVQ